MLLTAEQILSTKLNTKIIDIPRLGGKVRVQELTGTQRAELDMIAAEAKTPKDAYKETKAWIVIMSLVDEQGSRIFDDSQIDAIKSLPMKVQETINDEVDILSGLKEEAIKKTAKKSSASRDGTNSGSSRQTSAIHTPA